MVLPITVDLFGNLYCISEAYGVMIVWESTGMLTNMHSILRLKSYCK